MTFSDAITKQNNKTVTTNGMKALKETGSACVDLYFKIGASRGELLDSDFTAAFFENKDVATRILLATRDIRQGKGEREMFRNLFNTLADMDKSIAKKVLVKIPELGRWDDLLYIEDDGLKSLAFDMIKSALDEGNSLCAKWMPRRGYTAAKLRKHFKWSPKFYRKTLVGLTDVVENKMCENDWESIDFSKVPSKAFANYKAAFHKHSPEKFEEFLESVSEGTSKVNAGAIFPYDVIKGLYDDHAYRDYNKEINSVVKNAALVQWGALPDFVGDGKILPMIDVSGSMTANASGSTSVTCMDVALSLGLYCAEKNSGAFKDVFLTFTEDSHLCKVEGNIFDKIDAVFKSGVGYSTNITSAFESILETAKKGKVKQEDMPEYLIIFSDMQFDSNWMGKSAFGTLKKLYKKSGYELPKVVFWNINAHGNVPVKFSKEGVALVSGFSPSLVKTILSCDDDSFTPEGIMLKDVMNPRYDY